MMSHAFPVSRCAAGPSGLLRRRYGRIAFCRVCAQALAHVTRLANRSDDSYGNLTVPSGAKRGARRTAESDMLLIRS